MKDGKGGWTGATDARTYIEDLRKAEYRGGKRRPPSRAEPAADKDLQRVDRLHKRAPAVFDAVGQGLLTLCVAQAAAAAPAAVQAEVLERAQRGDTVTAGTVDQIKRGAKPAAPAAPDRRYLVQRVLSSIARHLDEMVREWELLQRAGLDGRAMTYAHCADARAHQFLGELVLHRDVTKAAVPHIGCLYCRGAAVEDGQRCNGCLGSGWMSKEQWESMGQAERDRLRYAPAAEAAKRR